MNTSTAYYNPIPGFKWLKLLRTNQEDSKTLRLLVFACIMVAIIALLSEEEWPALITFLVLPATATGFVISWYRRKKNNWVLKVIISILMFAALGNFFINLSRTPYDPRIPIANLLLWLQVLHSYDLPAQKDLNYSFLVSFILITLASVLSRSTLFAVILIAYFFLVTVTLLYEHYLNQQKKCDNIIALAHWTHFIKYNLKLYGIMLALSLVVFACFPQIEGFKIRQLPSYSIKLNIPFQKDARIINPGYPMAGKGDPDFNRQKGAWGNFNPNSYFGFTSYLDLNYRGKLSDQIVMKVKTTGSLYFRGMAFDKYTGQGWGITEEDVEWITSDNPPIYTPLESPGTGSGEVIQTFYIERELPNLIFASYQPAQIFFPANSIAQDRYYTLRSPFPLQEGIVYSVISNVPKDNLRNLRHTSGYNYPDDIQEKYLPLPPTITDETIKYALSLTKQYTDPLDKVNAIENHLRNSYPYDLDIPPPGENQDAVADFLFNTKRGYCEQFASAMAVLLRINGIPTRLATGYVSNSYNPFTSYYEVKGTDAHAWVEVYFNGIGWVQFDPSPGYSANANNTSSKDKWILGKTLQYIWGQILTVIPQEIRIKLPSPQYLAKFTLWFLLLLVFAYAIYFIWKKQLLFIFKNKLSQKNLYKLPLSITQNHINMEIANTYMELCNELYRLGHQRKESHTAYEYIKTLPKSLPIEEIKTFTQDYVAARFGSIEISKDSCEYGRKIITLLKSFKQNHTPEIILKQH